MGLNQCCGHFIFKRERNSLQIKHKKIIVFFILMSKFMNPSLLIQVHPQESFWISGKFKSVALKHFFIFTSFNPFLTRTFHNEKKPSLKTVAPLSKRDPFQITIPLVLKGASSLAFPSPPLFTHPTPLQLYLCMCVYFAIILLGFRVQVKLH